MYIAFQNHDIVISLTITIWACVPKQRLEAKWSVLDRTYFASNMFPKLISLHIFTNVFRKDLSLVITNCTELPSTQKCSRIHGAFNVYAALDIKAYSDVLKSLQYAFVQLICTMKNVPPYEH